MRSLRRSSSFVTRHFVILTAGRNHNATGLMDFIKKELIEIIEWQDDSRDTLSYRWPDDDKQIKNNAQLIVRESQVAQFVYLGQYADTLAPASTRCRRRTFRCCRRSSAGNTVSRRRSGRRSTTSHAHLCRQQSGARRTRS